MGLNIIQLSLHQVEVCLRDNLSPLNIYAHQFHGGKLWITAGDSREID